jgi:hypothetical protein
MSSVPAGAVIFFPSTVMVTVLTSFVSAMFTLSSAYRAVSRAHQIGNWVIW